MHDMESRIKQLDQTITNKDVRINDMMSNIENLHLQLSEAKLNANSSESLAKTQKLVAELEQKYKERNKYLSDLEEKIIEKGNDLETVNLELQNTQKSILCTQSEAAELELRMDQLNRCISEKVDMVDNLEREIDEMKNTHSIVLAEYMREIGSEEKEGWVLQARGREPQLVELIGRLVDMYPELRMDLAAIEWKKVWLPKIQELCSREGLDGKCGIYKITVIGDETTCYIGQAVNVKDRWYTHIRKMLGVEAKGSERLYDYRPDQV